MDKSTAILITIMGGGLALFGLMAFLYIQHQFKMLTKVLDHLSRQLDRTPDGATIRLQLKAHENRLQHLEMRIKEYDANINDFYKSFSTSITEAVKPMIDGVIYRITALEQLLQKKNEFP